MDRKGCGVGMDDDAANQASVESGLLDDLMAGEVDEAKDVEPVRRTMMELAIMIRTKGLHEAAECLQERVDDIKRETRRVTFNAVLAFIWTEMTERNEVRKMNPWQAFKRFLAMTRRVNASLLNGISQTEVGMILGEGRAAVSAREKFIERFLKSCGAKGFLGTGGVKSASSIPVFADAQRGNHNRRSGTRKRRAKEFIKG